VLGATLRTLVNGKAHPGDGLPRICLVVRLSTFSRFLYRFPRRGLAWPRRIFETAVTTSATVGFNC
jgi:hypothetical protein